MDRNPEIHQKETESEERFGKDAQQTERDQTQTKKDDNTIHKATGNKTQTGSKDIHLYTSQHSDTFITHYITNFP